MQTQFTRRIEAAAYLLFAAGALTLAGCGNHAQNTPATPAQIQMGKMQEQQAAFSRTAAGGQKPQAARPSGSSGSSQGIAYQSGGPTTH